LVVQWTISGGNTCNGIKIFRSTDSLHFEQIGFISGICGNSTIPVSYVFNDENPLANKTNFYKLELGTLGHTKTASYYYIVYNEAGYLVKPNPVTDLTTIFFENDLQEEYEFNLYNQEGQQVINSEFVSGNNFILYRNDLAPGTYLFTLQSQGKIYYEGKIIFI
jgi:hypothetical protein